MNVGLIIYGSLETVSGGYLYDRQLVAYLRRQGDDVALITLPWSSYGRHLTHNLSKWLFSRLRQAPFDLLLQDELNHPSLFWLNRRLRPYISYPLISIVHHLRCSESRPAWQNWLYRWIEQRYLNSVDGFIFNSQTTASVVNRLASGPGVVAFPAGDRFQPDLTAEEITRRALASGPLRLIFLGNLIPRKGLHRLLSALAQLPRDGWQLTVVGDTAVAPSYTRSIFKQIQRADLTANVSLAGSLADSDLADCLRQSHVLAMLSDYEGYGIVYLEGMGFGLPAIASTAGAAHEIITHEENGFLLNPGAPLAAANLVETLINDRAMLARLSLAARERYLRQPTWVESMAQIRQFLRTANSR